MRTSLTLTAALTPLLLLGAPAANAKPMAPARHTPIGCVYDAQPFGGPYAITYVTGTPNRTGRVILAQGGVNWYRTDKQGKAAVVTDAVGVGEVRLDGQECLKSPSSVL